MKKLTEASLALLAIVGLYGVMACLGITCPILYLTGISCAGCGMTRAWISCLHGNLPLAMHYHPLFWFVIPSFLWIITGKIMNKKVFYAGITVITLIFLICYIWRMYTGPWDVVYFHPERGAIACFYKKILFLIGGKT